MLCAVLAGSACVRPPRDENYPRVDLFGAGKKQIEFVCQIGFHSYDTFVGTTPWTLELTWTP